MIYLNQLQLIAASTFFIVCSAWSAWLPYRLNIGALQGSHEGVFRVSYCIDFSVIGCPAGHWVFQYPLVVKSFLLGLEVWIFPHRYYPDTGGKYEVEQKNPLSTPQKESGSFN